MHPSTGPGGATPEQSGDRQEPPSPCPQEPYEAPSARSTGGRHLVGPAWAASTASGRDVNRPGRKHPASRVRAMERPETRVTVLPDAGREESLELWGLTRSHRWGEAERRPRHSDELELDADAATPEELELEELGFLLDGGWSTVDTTRGRTGLSSATGGARDAGMSSHRGVLHPHEHVDAEALRPAVEAELGFTLDDVHAVYRQGRKSAAQLELRARIDARLLEVAEAGGNLTELGRALGFPVHEGSTPWAMKQAVARARQERSATS